MSDETPEPAMMLSESASDTRHRPMVARTNKALVVQADPPAQSVPKEELLGLLDLLERIRRPAEELFGLREPDPQWNMIVYLLKRNLGGLLVTPTSLARAAGVPYTTALRRIDMMQARGLLQYRQRTKSGLSFSVHPTQGLLDRVHAYARAINPALTQSRVPVGDQKPSGNAASTRPSCATTGNAASTNAMQVHA